MHEFLLCAFVFLITCEAWKAALAACASSGRQVERPEPADTEVTRL
jgi:hypothetical protein